MKILIVDDSKLIRDRLIESLLAIKDVEIAGEATNGIEALQIINNTTPDFIIMDIRMPEMNGITVLEKMKEQGSKSKVCIFTNYPHLQYKQKCFKMGTEYFFDKNNDFQELINLVTRLSDN
jgi:YesN/AraC family two-component response regulator